jgi:hypothetical protein
MSLKVTIKDAAGNPTTLDVHEMHITSNDANSINVAPTWSPAAPHAFQQQQYPAPLQNFGAQLYNNFAPGNAPQLVFDKPNNVAPNLSNSQNNLRAFGEQLGQQNGQYITTGGSKKRRNKRKKRTRKRRQSRKKSTKR